MIFGLTVIPSVNLYQHKPVFIVNGTVSLFSMSGNRIYYCVRLICPVKVGVFFACPIIRHNDCIIFIISDFFVFLNLVSVFPISFTGLIPAEPIYLAAEVVLVKSGLIYKILLLCPPLRQLDACLGGVGSCCVHCHIFTFPPTDLAFNITLLLAGFINAQFLAVIGYFNRFILLQLFPRICPLRKPFKIREKGMAAIPPAEACSGAIAC